LPALYSTPFIFAAFFAREVLKTIPDAEGDRANGVSNITTRYGVLAATRIAQIMLGLVAATLPLLRLAWVFNSWFLVAVFLVVWPFMAFLILRLAPRSDPDNSKVNTVLRLSKLLFLVVALVILVGSFHI
jgi:4-hydroxybenzoate polyprenyltransferase